MNARSSVYALLLAYTKLEKGLEFTGKPYPKIDNKGIK
jgi:hypothetical protein